MSFSFSDFHFIDPHIILNTENNEPRISAIVDFRPSINKPFTLLGYYAAWIVVIYRCFWIGFRSLSSKVKQIKKNSPCTAFPLKIGPIGCPETSVTNTLRYIASQKSEVLDPE
jgi:hypothetical protein